MSDPYAPLLSRERRDELEDAITALSTACYMRGRASDWQDSVERDAEIQSARDRLNRLLGLRQYATKETE